MTVAGKYISAGSQEALSVADPGLLGYNTIEGPGWPIGANIAVGWPLMVFTDEVTAGGWFETAAGPGGNWDVGIYDENYNRLAHTGSFAAAGVRVLNSRAWTGGNVTLATGARYYCMTSSDQGANGVLNMQYPDLPVARLMGVFQAAAAFPLPATLTPAVITTQYISYGGYYLA